jgi:threonine dehydratase
VGDGRPPPPFHLKCEHFQPMGAFKLRGAYNVLAQLGPDARAAGVITYSSGNHGRRWRLSAQLLWHARVVVMPETAPRVKVDGTRKVRRRGDLCRAHVRRSPLCAPRPKPRRTATRWCRRSITGSHRGRRTVGLEIVDALDGLSASSCRSAAADCCRALRPR